MACNPVTFLQSLKGDQSRSYTERLGRRSKHDQSRKSVRGHSHWIETSSKPASGTSLLKWSAKVICHFCKKNHDCFQFLAKSLEERKAYLKENRLCFACYNSGHVSRKCNERKQSKTCLKFHPSSLHGDFQKGNAAD